MVPNAMSYQGFLTDAAGDPVAPTASENRDIEFRIYSTAAGGTALWGETQTVTVYKGNFSVILGNGTALSVIPSGPAAFASVFTNASSADLYFGITPVGGSEFAPRQKLLSSAYALRAKAAETVNASAQANGVPSQFNWASANNLTVNGPTRVSGANSMQFGYDVPGKEEYAGRIGYGLFDSGLDIVGAGNSVAERKIVMHAQGGTDFLGQIKFGSRGGEHIVLFENAGAATDLAIGVMNGTIYSRVPVGENFRWYQGGNHDHDPGSPTNGTQIAVLNASGFTLNSGRFTGDGSGLTNLPAPSTVNDLQLTGTIHKSGHGVFISSFVSHQLGSQDHTTYFRTSVGANNGQGSFAWYRGGSHDGGELNAGGGTRLMTLNGNGLEVNQGNLSLAGSVNFGQRLGQHLNLYGTSNGIGIQNSRLYHRDNTGFSWFVGGSHSNNTSDAGGGSTIADWDNSRLEFNRRVYITGDTGSEAPPLDVNGGSNEFNFAGGTIARFYRTGGGGAGYDNSGTFSRVSIRANHVIEGFQFVAKSDLRLKLPEARSDSAKDLATLGALEVTDYQMKDRSAAGERKFKKLIAQQVEAVYPQAVSKSTGVVPDIYRLAAAKGGFIAFKEAGQAGLQKGDVVRLVGNDWEVKSEVTEVREQGFTVKDEVKDGEVFVYGRQVRDLRSIDYEAISMLNVSATQELARQIKAQAAENGQLRAENAELRKQLAAMKADAAAADERLARIESLLKGGERPAVQPVSIKTVAR